jgi:diguanylate cyclase (GGDEF)-like protein
MTPPLDHDAPGATALPSAVEAALAALVVAHAQRRAMGLAVKAVESGEYVFANDAMATLLGAADAVTVRGQTDMALLGAARAAPLRAADDTAVAAWPQPTLTEHRLEGAGGRLRQQVTRLAVPEAPGGRPRWLVMLWADFGAQEDREATLQRTLQQLEAEQTAQRQLREQLAALSADGGRLAGRGGSFDEQLRREADLSAREQRDFSLVLIELDPVVADPSVDAAQARERARDALDRLLAANIRAMDATARLDDDRFGVLLSGVGLATAHARLEGLRRQCATQVLALSGRDVGFSISVGVASFPHSATTRGELVEAAQAALAEAQRRGGNQIRLASIRFAPHGTA